MPITEQRPVHLQYTKAQYEKDPFALTQEAIEILENRLDNSIASLREEMDAEMKATLATTEDSASLKKQLTALEKKVTTLTNKTRAAAKKQAETLDQGNLGYAMGHLTANVPGGLRNPRAATQMAGGGIAGFFQAFTRGWKERMAQYEEVTDKLEQERLDRLANLPTPVEPPAPA